MGYQHLTTFERGRIEALQTTTSTIVVRQRRKHTFIIVKHLNLKENAPLN
jgi:hypothetical protein